MLFFLQTYNLINFRYKLLTLYFLNVLDILLTKFLLNTGSFMEINPFMINIVNNSLKVLLLKILLPAILLLFLNKRINDASIKQLKISHKLINIMLIFYTSINMSHIFWSLVFK